MRTAREVRRVRDVRDDAVLCLLSDPLLGKPEESDIEIVQKLLANSPPCVEKALAFLYHNGLSLHLLLSPADAFVVIDEIRFLVESCTREPVVRWIAENDDDLRIAFHASRRLVLLSQLGEVHFDLIGTFHRKCIW